MPPGSQMLSGGPHYPHNDCTRLQPCRKTRSAVLGRADTRRSAPGTTAGGDSKNCQETGSDVHAGATPADIYS